MNNVKNLISNAKNSIRKNDFISAEEVLSSILRIEPNNTYAKKQIKKLKVDQTTNQKNFEQVFPLMVNLYQNLKFNDLEKYFKLYSDIFDHEARFHNLRGLYLKNINDYHLSQKSFERALEIDNKLFEAINNLGNLHFQFRFFNKAIDTYSSLIKLCPEYAGAYSNRSTAFLEIHMFEKALIDINRAISIEPNNFEYWYNKSSVHMLMNDFENSLSSINKSIELNPKNLRAYNNKSYIFEENGFLDEAYKYNEICIRAEPNNPKYLYNKGSILNRSGLLKEAEIAYLNCLKINPNHTQALWNLSNCQLLNGNYKDGFKNFELRKKMPFWKECKNDIPELESLNDLENKKILVYSEQGLGDTIQFSRLVNKLSSFNCSITFQVQKPLKDLLKLSSKIKIVSEVRFEDKFDFKIPLLSLPKFFLENEEFFVEPIQFKIDLKNDQKWRNNLPKDKFKIGICWEGNAEHKDDKRGIKFSRSFPLENLKFLKNISQVYVVSLQKGNNSEQININNLSSTISHLDHDFDNHSYAFYDSVSIIKNLDLVITCDTSIAHVAGSLGCEVWVPLKFVSDWRWLVKVNFTKWYPKMKLYRQKSLGNWDNVFKEIHNDLLIKVCSK